MKVIDSPNRRTGIGINAGGDDPQNSLRGAYLAAEDNPSIDVFLYLEPQHFKLIHRNQLIPNTLENLIYREVQGMRCLQLALQELSKGKINALITASNSAELMLRARRLNLWSSKGVWPGLLAPIPIRHKFAYLMDAGATSWLTDPQVFLGWGNLGRNYLARRRGIRHPRIYLANISHERAFPELEAIDQFLQANLSGYQGFAEPSDFWRGEVDLLLCNGYIGNLFLKQTEAVAEATARIILDGLSTGESRDEAILAMRKLMYGEHLLSPWLSPKHHRVFRVHGNTPAKLFPSAVNFAITRFKVAPDRSTW